MRGEAKLSGLKAAGAATETLVEPPEEADPLPLRRFAARLEEAAAVFRQTASAAAQLGKKREVVGAEMDAWAEAHPHCPTCRQPIRAELLRNGEHAHA